MPSAFLGLPRELQLAVLHRLSLAQLRLLKFVSRTMANRCRAVLRSESWQDVDENRMDLEMELNTQRHSYRFPFCVSFFPQHFPEDKPCIATVHYLKLARCSEESLEYLPKGHKHYHFTEDSDCAEDVQLRDWEVITDMCIELHGHGVVGSDDTLRKLLQTILRERGCDDVARDPTRQHDANTVWTFRLKQSEVGDFHYEPTGRKKMPLRDLLHHAKMVTEVAKNKWMVHEHTWAGIHEYLDYCRMSLFSLCTDPDGPLV